jgi:hypothetical protein
VLTHATTYSRDVVGNWASLIIMKYLLENQIKGCLRPNKSIEQIIGKFEVGKHLAIRYISIVKEKDKYCLMLHDIFDDRDEGIEDIYEFSYVEPDDMYGKEIKESSSLEEILIFAQEEYDSSNERYLTLGFLNEDLENINEFK